MADGVQYSSATAVPRSKRKYEDRSTPPPVSTTRRPSGFSSAPIAPPSPETPNPPTPSYSVPSHLEEFQIAKQRAQEIAARLFNSVDPNAPRPDNAFDQKPPFSNFYSGSAAYGYQGSSKKIDIPNNRVGVIIGKSGETVKNLQLQSGARIQITRDMDADPNSQTRLVEIVGTPEQVDKAEQLLNDVLAEADAAGSSLGNKRMPGQAGAEQLVMKIPNNRVGLVIGKGGETIKNMQASTGARIQVIPLHLPPGDMSTERTIQIDGTSEQIESAQQMVNEVISENRMRNQSSVGGGYANNQQAYRQSYQPPQQQQQPPTNWGVAPPPMNQDNQQQQPGYGYMQQQQPVPFSGPPPVQYNLPQPAAYSAYPHQSAGYAASWDMTNQNPQSNPGGGGYDYYTQQPQTTTPSSYTYAQQQQQQTNYPQPQSYPNNPQDGYGGGVSQPPAYGQQQNPIPGYEQQGYINTHGSTNSGITGQTQDVNSASYGGGASMAAPQMQSPAAPHGYGVGAAQQASPNTGYGLTAPSPTAQPGYGNQHPQMMMGQGGYGYGGVSSSQATAAVTVPGYGQSHVSPGGQGSGYVNPSAAYAQPPSNPPPIPHQQPAGYSQVEVGGTPSNYNSGYGSTYGGQLLTMYGQQPMPPSGGAAAEKDAAAPGGRQIGASP